jgi:hypothetical protein
MRAPPSEALPLRTSIIYSAIEGRRSAQILHHQGWLSLTAIIAIVAPTDNQPQRAAADERQRGAMLIRIASSVDVAASARASRDWQFVATVVFKLGNTTAEVSLCDYEAGEAGSYCHGFFCAVPLLLGGCNVFWSSSAASVSPKSLARRYQERASWRSPSIR